MTSDRHEPENGKEIDGAPVEPAPSRPAACEAMSPGLLRFDLLLLL